MTDVEYIDAGPARLVTFVRARLDDDEQAAHMAIVKGLDGSYDGERWSVVDRRVRTDDGSREGVAIARTRHEDPGAAEHIARHDPARVLAEVAIWRQAVSTYVRAEQDSDAPAVSALLGMLSAKAAIYSEHPDYAAASADW